MYGTRGYNSREIVEKDRRVWYKSRGIEKMKRTPLMTGLVWGTAILSGTLAGCAGGRGNPVSTTELALGTQCTITVYSAKDADMVKTIFPVVHEIEERMSVRLPDSEVSRINASAGIAPVPVSPDTYDVIKQGLSFSELSGGHFDVTVGPIVSLWGIGTENPRVPSSDEIARAVSLTDYTTVVLDDSARSVFLPEAGQAIDLGGIAKGWAIGAVISALRGKGVDTALLNFGGNVCTLGTKKDGSPWRIGIQDPWDLRGNYIAIVEAGEKAVATSGKYERFFIADGVRYHHILDTRTGYPVENGVASVSIVSSDPTQADALSTAVFSMGLEDGYALLLSLPEVDGVIITEEKRILVTPGIAGRFTLKDERFTMMEAP